MSDILKKVVLINGSPKPANNKSASEFLISLQEDCLKAAGAETSQINARNSVLKGKEKEDFEKMNRADAVIFTFPLYVFCLPGVLMRYLQDYYEILANDKVRREGVKIYAVVNCGFPEADINEEAVRVIQSFSKHIGADFRFGVMIGAGGMLLGAMEAPFMKKTRAAMEAAFQKISNDIMGAEPVVPENIRIESAVPRRMYYFFGNRGWYGSARKYKLKKKDLFRQPYLNKEKE